MSVSNPDEPTEVRLAAEFKLCNIYETAYYEEDLLYTHRPGDLILYALSADTELIITIWDIFSNILFNLVQ